MGPLSTIVPIICGALRNLLPFVQIKKREKQMLLLVKLQAQCTI